MSMTKEVNQDRDIGSGQVAVKRSRHYQVDGHYADIFAEPGGHHNRVQVSDWEYSE